jgi:dihydroflavonol-4-reductase
VARGHLLAARSGKSGERYILGGQNMRWSAVMERVAKLAPRRHPLLVLPPETASAANLLRQLGVPILPLEGIRLMAPDWRYSSARAKRELGYKPCPVNQTLQRTVEWYLELIEAGRFRGSRRNSFDLMAASVRLADRAGLLGPLKEAGRLAGRRVVV